MLTSLAGVAIVAALDSASDAPEEIATDGDVGTVEIAAEAATATTGEAHRDVRSAEMCSPSPSPSARQHNVHLLSSCPSAQSPNFLCIVSLHCFQAGGGQDRVRAVASSLWFSVGIAFYCIYWACLSPTVDDG